MFVDNVIEYKNYFSRAGDTISVRRWEVNEAAIERIQKRILDNFIVNDYTWARGIAVVLLMIDCEREIMEMRVINSLSKRFDKELLRVVNMVEKDLVLICTVDCKIIPIVTPFGIRLVPPMFPRDGGNPALEE